MKKSKIKNKEVVMHQHIDELGHKFGSKHPLDATHKNPTTQKYHNVTVGK